jgi:hypothetical protein
MRKEVIVRVKDITKVRKFDDSIVIYTRKTCWVCVKDQRVPTPQDLFITLKLKDRSDDNGQK